MTKWQDSKMYQTSYFKQSEHNVNNIFTIGTSSEKLDGTVLKDKKHTFEFGHPERGVPPRTCGPH
jgi:hypothetical protein